MNNDGGVNFEALRSLLQWHVASGTDGLCILGTTAEATTLSMEERECKKGSQRYFEVFEAVNFGS